MVVKANTQSPPPQAISYTAVADCCCGETKLPVTLASQKAVFDLSSTWQKLTGTLVVFYTQLLEPPEVNISRSALSRYAVDEQTEFTAYFCKTCSAHVCFRIKKEWYVHTATLEDAIVKDLAYEWIHSPSLFTEYFDGTSREKTSHRPIAKSLSDCVREYVLPNTSVGASKQDYTKETAERESEVEKDRAYLHGSCYCGSVQLRLTRPTAQSYPPYTVSPFPDFLQPFYETSAEEQDKPADTAWWIIDKHVDISHGKCESQAENDSKRYIAAFCSCTSCRKMSGSELQQWAFLPECCISIKYKPGAEFVAWPDFWPDQSSTRSIAMEGDITIYESSKNVIRGSCRICGAMVFWNGRTRTRLVDIGVGLFVNSRIWDQRDPDMQEDGHEGKLDDGWFMWSTDRLSFVEDAKGRGGLVKDLELHWKKTEPE